MCVHGLCKRSLEYLPSSSVGLGLFFFFFFGFFLFFLCGLGWGWRKGRGEGGMKSRVFGYCSFFFFVYFIPTLLDS